MAISTTSKRVLIRKISDSSRILLAGLLLCFFAANAAAKPAHIIITVPATTVAGDLPAKLASWRQSGLISNVVLVESESNQESNFSTVAVLEFPDDGARNKWEHDAAGDLGAELIVTRANSLVYGEKSPRDSSIARFLVSQYQVHVSPEHYTEYVDAYVVPQLEGWKDAGLLTSYGAYLAESESNAPWQSILVMEYRDEHALSRRDEVKTAVRAELAEIDPDWKAFSEIKQSLRTETSLTRSRWVELPPPDLGDLPDYVPEHDVAGGFRIIGSELKGSVEMLAEGFAQFHPGVRFSISHIPSSEGAIAGLYFGISDLAPAGDDAKITDIMPFYNTFRYVPTEVSIATGGYEKRGSLWAFAAVVSEDNPLDHISLEQLKRIFGAERTGGWEINGNNYRFTSKYARGKELNIRTWDQLGLSGEFEGREIETFGYAAPGFATYFERFWFHWSKKWNPNFKEYVEAKQTTPDEQGYVVASERPLEALKDNKFAIGLAALMHVKKHPGLKVLAVSRADDSEPVAFTPENVAERRYPLLRDAFLYVNKPPGEAMDPKVREFIRFCLSREGQEIIATGGYYFPLKLDYLTEQLKKLD